jgi:hypothetical protein
MITPSLEAFLKSGKSLVIYVQDQVVFESNDSDLKPLLEYIKDFGPDYGRPVIFDKYVGRAAALLMTLVWPSKVLTGVLSENGKAALEEAGLEVEYSELVKYLMAVASHDMCRWEKMSLGLDAQQFCDLILQNTAES